MVGAYQRYYAATGSSRIDIYTERWIDLKKKIVLREKSKKQNKIKRIAPFM